MKIDTTVDATNTKLAQRFPQKTYGPYRIEFSCFMASNPFSDKYTGNPLKWNLSSAQWCATSAQNGHYYVPLELPDIFLKDSEWFDRVVAYVEIQQKYLKLMLAAASVLAAKEIQ